MKKIFSILMLAALALCTVTMVSCKPDKEEIINPLVGTWSYTETDNYGTFYEEIIFNADGTFIWREKENNRWYTDTGTYSIQGNKLTLVYDDDDIDVWTFSINGNSLTLIEEDGGDTGIYTRK